MDSSTLKNHILSLGASLVGFAGLEGRNLPGSMGFPYAISFACALPQEVIKTLAAGPTPRYYEEYKRKNLLLDGIAREVTRHLQREGYRTVSLQATVADEGRERGYIEAFNNSLPHKTVATLSGMGWVGKSGLLITPEFGPRVRLGSVLTDMPLGTGTPVLTGRCGSCNACVDACPARAIRGKEWTAGLARDELFDACSCRRKALELSVRLGIKDSLCGVCIWACPR